MEIRVFAAGDEDAVVHLWRACALTRDWNDPYKDVARKVAIGDDLFLVGVLDDAIVTSVMAGYDGHRGWINYLAVDPTYQCKGLATLIMNEAERRLRLLGCPKLNLQVRTSNPSAIGFYERAGFVRDDVVSFGKRLEPED